MSYSSDDERIKEHYDALTKIYFAECKALAAHVKQETKARAKRKGEDADEILHDVLHETIDGHQWIIYTWYNWFVLWCSDNRDAYEEETGEEGGDLMVKAFWALQADVQRLL